MTSTTTIHLPHCAADMNPNRGQTPCHTRTKIAKCKHRHQTTTRSNSGDGTPAFDFDTVTCDRCDREV